MKRYNPSELEPKWQKIWQDEQRYKAVDNAGKKMYISCMFPYPSGAGMHTGHAFEHSIVDSMARFYRQHGYNVLNPMGWDSFGLPAENYAIKTGTAPAEVTKTNIANFKNQLERMGASIDWSREINTSDPEYYKWTQWIFTQLFERGLAYQKDSLQWWCPVDKTVLANEQVEGGRCWRCDSVVEKKSMNQWFLKITDYADKLLEEIPDLDWPKKIKTAQTNWIGRSKGAEVEFIVEGSQEAISVFTTRPDTLFGATFLVLAPEHELISKIVSDDMREAVDLYIKEAVKKSEIERMSEGKEKTGVFTGAHAINPATGKPIQIWIADYVLNGYGTGAVMAVPAHDERDFAFAEKFSLPIIEVVSNESDERCYSGEGTLINSEQFDGLRTAMAREQIVMWLEQTNQGHSKTTYKMRDWLISRQRYWGAPIPIVHVEGRAPIAVAESCLPVELPHIEDYAPKGNGSALATVDDWVNVWVNVDTGETVAITDKKPEGDTWVRGQRETDTMDGYACSSWYLLRYTDPQNNIQAWDSEKANYWAPLDMYVGGDHAVAHLLYVRFWMHVFKDMGITDFAEPVKKLVYHGYINAEDGTKMSKSKGNVVDPLDVIDQGYGADALRTFLLFLGPIELDANWSSNGIAGVYRFLNRAWTLVDEYCDQDRNDSNEQENALLVQARHKVVKKVTEDYHKLSFNTAIAAMMEYVNELYKLKHDNYVSKDWQNALEVLAQLLAPIAPHISAELWQRLTGQDVIEKTAWPEWDDSLLVTNTLTVAVQVNGKLRATIDVPADSDEDTVKQLAIEAENVVRHIDGKMIRKIIYVPKKLVNIVAI